MRYPVLLVSYVLVIYFSRISLPFNVVRYKKSIQPKSKHDVLCVVISYRKFKIERNTKRVTSSQGAKNEIIGRHDVVASSWLLYPVVLLDRVRGLLELPQPADTNSNFQLNDPHSATRSRSLISDQQQSIAWRNYEKEVSGIAGYEGHVSCRN